MEPLHPSYKSQLDAIAEEVQSSEQLAAYLEEEEEDQYKELREAFEPAIAEVYKEVAENHPLQLIALEEEILRPDLEGLFLPKILGYSVLRAGVDEHYRYRRPQDHFKNILLTICDSSNFECLRKRIGQTVQTGFALSSDIWITNLIQSLPNKRVRTFLQSQKVARFQDADERRILLKRYRMQFKNDSFHAAEFPTSIAELQVGFPDLYYFLQWRIRHRHGQNDSLIGRLTEFLETEAFQQTNEYVRILGLYICFFELNDQQKEFVRNITSQLRTTQGEHFIQHWLEFLQETFTGKLNLDDRADKNAAAIFDLSIKDDLSRYYALTNEIHSKGIVHEEVIASIREFYLSHAGLSDINACVRNIILGYLTRLMVHLSTADYHDWFELSKVFAIYMDIFNNEEFNQSLKDLCLSYVRRLMTSYTDKRGRDYQDIKRFVATNFVDFGFMNEKQIKEFFKTPRKKKKKEA